MHLAVKLPQLCVILEDLIANGTQIDAKDDRGKTALQIATANENTTAVAVLLKYGTNTYLSDEDMRQSKNTNNLNISNSNNNLNNKNLHETDSTNSWPDTEDEDSNYEKPLKESIKQRKESFKRDSLRVSSLVDETIVEELKIEDNTENDDYVICKPSTSREENIGEITNNSSNHIKLVWNESSSSSDETFNKVSESGTLGRTDTLKGREEIWTSNTVNKIEVKKENDDPFNADVMDELELLLLQETTHDKNVDFISQIKNLLDEEQPKPRVNLISPPPPPPPPPPLPTAEEIPLVGNNLNEIPVNKVKTINDSNINSIEPKKDGSNEELRQNDKNKEKVGIKSIQKLKKESKIEIEETMDNKHEEDMKKSYPEVKEKQDLGVVKPLGEIRRKSYADVVAQRSVKQAVIDELKTNIRAKSYADVVSSSRNEEVEQIKETKIPILNRANSNPSPSKQIVRQLPIESNILTTNQNNKQLTNDTNAINSNKALSKIPLPVKQSSIEQIKPIDKEIPTSEESIPSELESKLETKPISPKNPSEEPFVKSNKHKNGTTRSSKLQRKVTQLSDDLRKEMNEKSLLSAENDIIKDQLMQLSKKIQDENFNKFELEKKLIKLEAELNQFKFECEIKCKQNNAIKLELEQTVNKFEDIQRQCRQLENDNQKFKNQIKSMSFEEEILTNKLTQQSVSSQVCNHEDIITEWKSKVEQILSENERLKKESDEYKKVAIEKQLEYESQRLEWQKRNLELDSDLKRMQLELEVNAIRSTPEEQIELIKAVRDLNLLMVKLDDRITRNEENQQQKARSFNEDMFECARNLLDQMRLELTNFKEMLNNSVNREFKNGNEEKQLSAFESRIAELRSALERLEDQIQSQELQLIRQSDIISFASPLRKSSSSRELFISSNTKPKSWFVQTLFRLQSHIQSTPTGDSITAFTHQKTRLQKQIHELKSELGIFAESVH